MKFAILVEGMEPAPQGSKVVTKYGALRETCKRLEPLRQLVRKEARASCDHVIDGPCRVAIEFRMRRPLADYAANGELRKCAPMYHTKIKMDVDKGARAVLDSLTGIAFRDDVLVVDLRAVRRYCRARERPGALILVESIIDQPG